jgi:hypothetical protein
MNMHTELEGTETVATVCSKIHGIKVLQLQDIINKSIQHTINSCVPLTITVNNFVDCASVTP